MWQQQIYVNWNQKKTEYVCLLPELKQLIHFYDDVNSIYSIKQCWCSFLSSVLGVDCLGSGGWVRSSCVVFWVLTVDSVAASEQYVSSSIPDSEGWPPEPGPGPDTTTDTSDTCAKVSQCSGQARWRQQKRRKCYVMWNVMQWHNYQEAEAGGWYFSAMPLKLHDGGFSGHLLPLWLENLLMRPLSREECSVFT